jgi:hypothetical protein
MPDENTKKMRDVIFFFGAGASVDADIPNTYEFVDDFKLYMTKEDSELYKQLLKILEIREQFNESIGMKKKQVDVEQLLDTINQLIQRDREVLLWFYEKKVFSSNITEDIEKLQKSKSLLEDFIRERVIVKEETKLEYLKEILKFSFPLEIYSVNYDTCIEQLCHMNYLRYTDGFDTYWDSKNFDGDFDVRHYKMHGSVIWYENKKTKECVKIPVHTFTNGKPTRLRLIYGEDVEPLLIYPAQKMEYIEPLTELQLMFKERLANKDTKILVMVGYSLRDDYIIHMLWDAGRKNENLHILLINPDAQDLFEEKLRFINKKEGDTSRIWDRVVCLPYPFSTVIYLLNSYYVQKLGNISRIWNDLLGEEKFNVEPSRALEQWVNLLKVCIECEFSTKAEQILEYKIRTEWSEIPSSTHLDQREKILYGVKAVLHSVIAKDGFEDRWLRRVNESIRVLSIEKLEVLETNIRGFQLMFKDVINVTQLSPLISVEKDLITPILSERNQKLGLLSHKFEKNLVRTEGSFTRLKEFHNYLVQLSGRIEWTSYFTIRSGAEDSDKIKELLRDQSNQDRFKLLEELVMKIERKELVKIFGGTTFQFKFQDEQKTKDTWQTP